MSEEGITDALLPCPFCAAKIELLPILGSEEEKVGVHPGTALDNGCLLSGCSIGPDKWVRWNTRQCSLPPVKGTIVERVRDAIWNELCPGIRRRADDDEHYSRAATAAIEAMPIQKMVDGVIADIRARMSVAQVEGRAVLHVFDECAGAATASVIGGTQSEEAGCLELIGPIEQTLLDGLKQAALDLHEAAGRFSYISKLNSQACSESTREAARRVDSLLASVRSDGDGGANG